MTLVNLKVESGYGRLYVSGLDAPRAVRGVPGASYHDKRDAWMVSLTMETLRRMRRSLNVDRESFARLVSPAVLSWAQYAGRQEQVVRELHAKLDGGWREAFDWKDVSGHPVTGAYRAPFDHQAVMATVGYRLSGAAFTCEMGTGKTRAAIEAMRRRMLEGLVHTTIVVCPRGVMRTVWEEQVANWAPELRPIVLLGPVKERSRLLREVVRGVSRRVLIVNYDVLATMEGAILEAMAARPGKIGLLLDEMHKIKNPQAQVSKAAMRVALEAGWRLGMTGTPILQGAHDVWSQWYVVDLGLTFGANFAQFRSEFFVENPFDMKLKPVGGALEEIGQRMRRLGVRYRKDECLDLPPKLYERVAVEMGASQRKAYRQMVEDLVTELEDGEVAASNQLTMILRLTQITSGFLPVEDGPMHRFEPNPKLEALVEWARENAPSQKLIVWAWYKEDVRQLMARLREFDPVRIVGGITDDERTTAERRFQTDPACRVLVGNPASGGVGLNLQVASLAAYYSQSYSLGDRLQSEDRCHRSGSEVHERVTYVDFVCEQTIDEVIVAALLGKKATAEVVVDLRRHLGV